MRIQFSILIAAACAAGACSDCLPEPENDETPPRVRIVVDYVSPAGSALTAEHDSGQAAATITADRRSRLTILFTASDSAGLRSLHPAVTIQQTVGVGVERRYADIDRTTAQCPQAELSLRHEVRGTGERRTLIATAVAQDWLGLTSNVEPLTIRLE